MGSAKQKNWKSIPYICQNYQLIYSNNNAFFITFPLFYDMLLLDDNAQGLIRGSIKTGKED